MDKQIVVMIMGQDCANTISMCLESVKEADAVIYCDGGSEDNTFKFLKEFQYTYNKDAYPTINKWILQNKYNQEDKLMNGKQRNFYLNYLKENHKNDWCLVLDADEVLEDFGIQKIKQILTNMEDVILCPRIHHFIGDLGHEDFTVDKHYVYGRLFKVTDNLNYPEVEHPVLEGKQTLGTDSIHIWHLREAMGIFKTNKKYKNNLAKSNMHTETQLKSWNRDMILGTYPKKQVHYDSIPTPIKRGFDI